MELDMSALTYRFNYGKKIRIPICAWLIEGGDKQILVDTGANAELASEFRGFPAESLKSFEDALGGLGLTPSDIDIVIQTHLHWDHCANTSKCTKAKVVVQEEELKSAFSPHPILAPTYKQSLLGDLNFVVVRGHCQIVPGIELIPTPGHTPGCQSVAVSSVQGKAIITGFCCLKENFEPPREAPKAIREITPVLAPGIHLNAKDAFDSALLIKGLADILIPCHDPSLLRIETIP
jgi:N-acyl homoserine lactone hydrolase